MRILILMRDLSLNGVTTYNRTLAAELRRHGHEVHVWPGDASMPASRAPTFPLLHPWFEPLARRYVKHLRPDVILVNHFTQARLAQRLRVSTGIPWVAVMHNGHSPQRMLAWAKLFGNVAGIVTMCETMRAQYARLVEENCAEDAAPPVFLSRLPIVIPEPRQRVPGAPLTLAYCSRMSSSKGPRAEAWLHAVASLPEATQYKLLVIGGGSYLKHLRRSVAALGLQVEFTGTIADPSRLLPRVDVITGAGYSLMEGLVLGCAPVALGFGGCFGAITEANLDAAFAINFGDHSAVPLPDDAATIAKALREAIALLLSPASTEPIRARSVVHFSPSPIASELLGFLRERIAAAKLQG